MTTSDEYGTSVHRLYWAAATFAVLALPAFLADLPLAKFCQADALPGDLQRVLGWSEAFAHGLGVALIGLAIYVLDTAHRRQIPRMLASAYVAGMLANCGKLSIARVRPSYFAEHVGWGGSVTDTFLGWFPLLFGVPSPFERGFGVQSFPSGHTATAVGFAICLAYVYPRGRWLFVLLAVLAASQRMDVSAHYLSDTVAGAAVGCLGAALVADPRVLGRWFTRFEQAPQN